MMKIKIILIIIAITFISLSCKDQIVKPDPLEEEASLIAWDEINGKIVYKKNDLLYLADKSSRTIKNLGICYLFNLKWNKAGNEITGILDNNNEYSIEAYDLNGNHYELDEPSSFDSGTYDWLPDGRLAHITKLGYVYIENSKLTNDEFIARGMACSPDGEKIVVSIYDRIDSTSKLIEIDIATGDTSILESGRGYWKPVYSPDSKKVLFVNRKCTLFGGCFYDLCITPNILLVEVYYIDNEALNSDWSPSGGKVIFTTTDYSIFIQDYETNIGIMAVNGDHFGKVIPGGSNPLWIE